MSANENEDVTVPSDGAVFDCPGCAVESEDWPPTVIETNDEYWHPLCLLESHPQFEKVERKECPECGAPSPYLPATRSPEARACWVCLEVFPADAEKDEDIEIVEDWDHEQHGE